jgi:hypothetical protein
METATIALILSIWGSVIGTAVAIWDVYKWKTAGRPKLSLTVSGPMISTDPRITQKFLSINVTNVGQAPTTLLGLTYRYFKTKPSNPGKDRPDEQGFFNLFVINPPPLPHKLDVGEIWKHLLELRPSVETMASEGYFYVEIEDSTTAKRSDLARDRVVLSKPITDPNAPTLGIWI